MRVNYASAEGFAETVLMDMASTIERLYPVRDGAVGGRPDCAADADREPRPSRERS